MPPKTTDDKMDELFVRILDRHNERLAYNAAYQRDLRKIKKLGLNCTVAEWREKNASK